MKKSNINLYHGDCMEAMKGMKDNQYDLAIVDGPYGIGENGSNNHSRVKLAKAKNYKAFHGLDKEGLSCEYLDLINRKAKNWIIWGANHFIDNFPFNINTSCWIVWNKLNGKSDFADAELAITNFDTAVRVFTFQWAGMLQGDMKNKETRIHPTQKPVALYKWLLKNYAKEGDNILDTHGGSMSIALACHDMGFDLDLWEIDEDYFKAGKKRFDNHIRQLQLF